MLSLVEYTEEFLELSWLWLSDPEIKELTMTPDFTKKQQLNFFKNIKSRSGYFIYGVSIDGVKVGACGLKNISANEGEYWGYIGDKKYWGYGHGKEIINLCIQKAKDLGLKKINLKVAVSNERAIRLYRKYGFSETGIEDKCVVMRLDTL